MKKRYIIEQFSWERYGTQMNELYKKIVEKYPNGMYWNIDPNFCPWENTFVLIDQEKLQGNGEGKVIGKAQTIFFPKLDTEVSMKVKQRILFHYRVLPEYETEYEAMELINTTIVNRAMELSKTVSDGRECVLATSCTPNEEFYINHILEKGYMENSGAFCMRAKNIGELNFTYHEIPEIEIRDISNDFSKYKDDVLNIERSCFTDDSSNWDFYENCINEDFFLAYGAFFKNRLIGMIVADQSEGDLPEIEGLSVLSEFRQKKIAKNLISKVMIDFQTRKAEGILISVKNDNDVAIHLYHQMGFMEYRNEKMYIKAIESK